MWQLAFKQTFSPRTMLFNLGVRVKKRKGVENFLSVPLLCSLKSACPHTVSRPHTVSPLLHADFHPENAHDPEAIVTAACQAKKATLAARGGRD